MAYQVNVPQGPDIWSGYHRSLEGIGQGISSGVLSYLAEKKKKEESEKARQRLKELLTQKKQVTGTRLANPPLRISEDAGVNTGTPDLRSQYQPLRPNMTPTIGQKNIEIAPDIPTGLDKGSYDAMTIGTLSRKMLQPWEEEDRQKKIADEKAMLDHRARLARDEAEHKAGLERSELYNDPTKVTLSEQAAGNIRGFEAAIPSIQGAQDDPGFRGRGLQNIAAGGGVEAYMKPEYKERDVPAGGNTWRKEYSTDGGVTWKAGGVYEKKDGSSQENTKANQWRDDYFATLKSVAQKNPLGGIEDPQYNIALQIGDKYKNLNPHDAAITAYGEAGRVSAGVDYLTKNPGKGIAGLKDAGWKEKDIAMVAKLAGVEYTPAGTTPQGSDGMPPNAKQARDGKWYIPDPKRPGKYLRVD